MARSKHGPRVEYSGPIFEPNAGKRFRQNARDMLQQIAEDGEALVKAELGPHRGTEAPHISDYIEGRVASLTGKRWALTSVVSSTLHLHNGYQGYAQFLEDGHRGRNGAQSSFGGWFIFRRVANAIKRTRRPNQANLVKGLT